MWRNFTESKTAAACDQRNLRLTRFRVNSHIRPLFFDLTDDYTAVIPNSVLKIRDQSIFIEQRTFSLFFLFRFFSFCSSHCSQYANYIIEELLDYASHLTQFWNSLIAKSDSLLLGGDGNKVAESYNTRWIEKESIEEISRGAALKISEENTRYNADELQQQEKRRNLRWKREKRREKFKREFLKNKIHEWKDNLMRKCNLWDTPAQRKILLFANKQEGSWLENCWNENLLFGVIRTSQQRISICV